GLGLRFAVQGLAADGRIETYRATLAMIGDHPWLGTGLGTFGWAFPAYRLDEASILGVWELTHNTLLQTAAEMGLPVAAAVAGFVLATLAALARGVLVRRRSLEVVVGALAGTALVMLHSL